MADGAGAPGPDDSGGADARLALAGTVHTYESLGRAIVASALTQGGLDDGTLKASVTVRARPEPAHDDPPAGAAGEYTGHAGCISVTIFIGSHMYPLQVCNPL